MAARGCESVAESAGGGCCHGRRQRRGRAVTDEMAPGRQAMRQRRDSHGEPLSETAGATVGAPVAFMYAA